MIRNLEIILIFLIGTIFINAQKKLDESLILKFYSSKQNTFDVTISNKSNLVKFSIDKIVYVADSLSETPSFSKMDSTKLSLIENFIDTNDIFYKTTNSITKNKLFEIIKKLNSCSKNINSTENGLVYISYNENQLKSKKYCQYTYDSLEKSNNDKLMKEFLTEIEKIFSDNSVLKKYINSTKIYFKNSSIKIVSQNPLYIKLYNLPPYHYPIYTSCEKLEEQVKSLPNSAEIFIDITEYQGHYEKCVKEIFYKKYKHLNWIQNNMFDTFNSIEDKK